MSTELTPVSKVLVIEDEIILRMRAVSGRSPEMVRNRFGPDVRQLVCAKAIPVPRSAKLD
jgi:hypothetical protein